MPNREPLKPWRNVTFIKESVGPRGGEYWWLTLECGHHKAVAIPVLSPAGSWRAESAHSPKEVPMPVLQPRKTQTDRG